MTFHPPSAYVPTNTARTTSPSLTDFPTLGSAKSTSARSTSEMISASHLTSTSDTEKMPNIPPIGTERTSPTTAMQPRLYGKDINAGRRDSSNPGHGLGLEITTYDYPSEAIEDTSTQQGQYLWQQLQHLKQQQQGSHQAVPYALPYEAQLQQQSYAEEAAQYLKKQQDEIALRHAEDLATGRAQPSGEGGFHPPPGPSDPTNTTVFVGGLHHNVTEPELFKFFQPFGQICYVKIPPGKGCGFVQYVEKHCAQLALERMQGFMLNGCKIRLSWGRTGMDKVSKSQDAQMRALVALQGLGSMSPEHLEKLNFAMELVNNEPLFRQITNHYNLLAKQDGGLPLDGNTMGSNGLALSEDYESRRNGSGRTPLLPQGPNAWGSSRSSVAIRPSQQSGTSQNNPLHGFSPFSPSLSPASSARKLRAQEQDDFVQRSDRYTGDTEKAFGDDRSPTRASTGHTTPGFPSSFSSMRSIGSIPALSSSSSQSQLNTSPSSATSNKFEQAFGLSPSTSQTLNDTQLFEAFAYSPPPKDYTRTNGGRLSQGSIQLGSSAGTLRPRSLSAASPTAHNLGLQMGGLDIGRSGNRARSPHPFVSAFAPLSPINRTSANRK